MTPTLDVLFEDNHLLVINKPAGMPTMGVSAGHASLWRIARDYLKHKYHKPGNVYLGIVSRLDALVTGVVVLARTSKAAARLSEQFRDATVEKIYWAIVERPPRPPAGRCQDWLRKDESRHRMTVVEKDGSGAQDACLDYRTVGASPLGTLVEIRLQTGRKHQIRVQLSHRGWPILGDRKYGSRRDFPRGIALHARHVSLVHPVKRTRLSLTAPPPPEWGDLAQYGAGD